MIHRHPFWVRAGLVASTTIFAHATLAQTSPESSFGMEPEETMVVTAKRSPESIENTLARVSVIDRADIVQSQASDLKDLLQTKAGVDLSRTGGPGGQTSVFMRGANSNHVLVLIDGIRVSAAGTGAFQWELMDLATVERIEIVRGPRAARWGSDAIGGVIQIFTRQASGASARALLGSYGERGASVAFGKNQQSISASTRRIDGFSSQNERGFSFDPDDDGYSNEQLAGQGGMALGNGDLRWSGRWLNGEAEFDQGISDVEQYAGQVGFQTTIHDWRLHLDGGFYRDRLETTTAFGFSENTTRRTQLSMLANTNITPALEWTLGIDAWRENGTNVGTWQEERDNWGIWSGVDGSNESLSYSASIRLDDDERFGQETTGQLALGWEINDGLRTFASIGQGFRSPNFSQLFSPGFGGLFAGNPSLQPETSLSGEWGLDWNVGKTQRFGLSAFHTSIEDLIDFSGPDFGAINIKKAKIKGLELTHQFQTNRWDGEFNWTWQQAEDTDLNQPLLRRPKTKASAVINYSLGNHRLGTELIYFGKRFDVGQIPLSPYTLINLTGHWQLNEHFALQTRLVNLAGADYEPLIGFNAAGRSATIALEWRDL